MSFIVPCPAGLEFSYAFEATAGGALTLPGVNIGPASPERVVVVATSDAAGTPPTAMTIGGIAATRRAGLAGSHTQIWTASVPTGTTATIVITASSSLIEIGVYALYGVLSEVPSNTATGTTSVNLTVPAGSCAIAASVSGTAGTPAWTGLTRDYNATNGAVMSSASALFPAAQSPLAVSVLPAPTSMAAAAWP